MELAHGGILRSRRILHVRCTFYIGNGINETF